MIKRYIFLFFLLPAILVAQHSIVGKMVPPENFDWVLLYKVMPESSVYIDRTNIDREGNFEFELDSTITKGMYRLVYAIPQEEYNFDIIYSAQENVSLIFREETGIEYIESIENKLMTSYTNSMGMISQSIGNFYRQQSTDSIALISIFKTQLETQKEFEKISENTIAQHFIKANKPYIPDEFEDIKTYISNLKTHYFDYVDFGSKILQSSSFLVERTLNYVFGMTSDLADFETYKKNVNEVVDAMDLASDETKKMLLYIIWQQMADTNYEEVANYIADSYLIKLAKELKEEELLNSISVFKNLSIGQFAPDFNIPLESQGEISNSKLSELNDFNCYVVVFWSSTCSHCLEELPMLHELIKDLDKGKVKIIAVGLEDDEINWNSTITNYPEFLHILGLGKWQNEIGITYNVSSTPTYFVLDSAKRITAKPIDFESLKSVLCD